MGVFRGFGVWVCGVVFGDSRGVCFVVGQSLPCLVFVPIWGNPRNNENTRTGANPRTERPPFCRASAYLINFFCTGKFLPLQRYCTTPLPYRQCSRFHHRVKGYKNYTYFLLSTYSHCTSPENWCIMIP